MNDRPGILMIERDTIVARSLEQALEAQGYLVHHASSLGDASDVQHRLRAKTNSDTIGVVLIDHDAMGGKPDVLRDWLGDWPGVVPIVTSAFGKIESAVQAMRLGAADYLLKPIVESELIDAVKRAEQRHLLMVERELTQQEVAQPLDDSPTEPGVQDEAAWQPMPLSEAMKAPERRILRAALEANGWNRGETAKQLDINRTTLYKKIRQHRLDEPAS